jgi:transcriptional regulator with XRE-family HTH domain
MTLALRIRDCRYAKGWGPDELAHRASISRTALYQIESGKTEQPRAGTLQRIAEALSVSTDTLLGPESFPGTRGISWPSAGLQSPPLPVFESRIDADGLRFSTPAPTAFAGNGWLSPTREREVERKLGELLHSSIGESVARIVEESYRLLPSRFESAR